MTAEEIKREIQTIPEVIKKGIDGAPSLEYATAGMQITFLSTIAVAVFEVAYQLAVWNEREQGKAIPKNMSA